MFSDYLFLGLEHILDTNGYDHILFIATLCAFYLPVQWKKILILVTAFTLGHSLTLALSALEIVNINPTLIETLIPITIILTGLFNIYAFRKSAEVQTKVFLNYLIALGFGLIHGLGFSNYFKAILGTEESVIQPLFAFNIGVEVGQIIIVGIVMSIAFLMINVMKVAQKYWTIPMSVLGVVVATYLVFK